MRLIRLISKLAQKKDFSLFNILRNHPFSLFIYLEWILLTICLMADFRIGNLLIKPPFFTDLEIINPFLFFVTFSLFGIMGLQLPKAKPLHKLLYTITNFLLILCVNYIGGRGVGFPPVLLMILVLRSCLVFKIYGRLVVAIFSWIFFILTLNTNFIFNPSVESTFINPDKIKNVISSLKLTAGVFFSFLLLFLLLLVNALISERQSRKKLVLANEQLRQYAIKIEDQATLKERNRIAREIHDSLGHSLTAQSIQLENALLFIESNPHKTKDFLVSAKSLGNNALKEVRISVATLRSDPLKGKSLETAIKSLLLEFQSRSQIQPKLALQINQILSPEINLAIYRIIQEALTNISKHSQADLVTIDIQTVTNSLYLNIKDNGLGFEPNQNTTGFGLQSMRDRTNALDGKFYLDSQPGAGCTIMTFFPLSRLD